MTSADVIAAHRAAGRTFTAGGVQGFVREAGDGDAVLCMHGVPASSFLYRKVIDELAARGLRGVAFDLPGLGLADRPADFDYTWTGLGRYSAEAVDALGLDAFHLVVHDVGGPVGFELAALRPERVLSLTILNTLIDVDGFRRPWSMEPFAHRGIGPAYLKTLSKPAFRMLMGLQGVADRSAVRPEELDAYVELLKRQDGGRAFLKIMRGFERTAEKQARYRAVVASDRYPVQVVWGEQDPALKIGVHGEVARRVAGLDTIHRLPAKHFLQEDQAPALAQLIATFAEGLIRRGLSLWCGRFPHQRHSPGHQVSTKRWSPRARSGAAPRRRASRDQAAGLRRVDHVVDLEERAALIALAFSCAIAVTSRTRCSRSSSSSIASSSLRMPSRTAPSRPIGPRWAPGHATVSSGSCRLPPTIACAPSP